MSFHGATRVMKRHGGEQWTGADHMYKVIKAEDSHTLTMPPPYTGGFTKHMTGL